MAPQPLYNGKDGTAREDGTNRRRHRPDGISRGKRPVLCLLRGVEYGFFDKGVQVFAAEAFSRRMPLRAGFADQALAIPGFPELFWTERTERPPDRTEARGSENGVAVSRRTL